MLMRGRIRLFDFLAVHSYAKKQACVGFIRQGGVIMGKYCEVCGKGTMSGNLVSHSNRKTRTSWAPNVQRVNAIVNGTPKKMNVCTRCLRTGRVQRSV